MTSVVSRTCVKIYIFVSFICVCPAKAVLLHRQMKQEQHNNSKTMKPLMTLQEAVKSRHSVRQYTDKPIDDEAVALLQDKIQALNAESGLHIQLVSDEPQAFDSFMAHYGKFAGVRNYFALIGSGDDLDERCGYYGEYLVLLAQQLGLNTCWVGLTFKKVVRALNIRRGEKLAAVIAVGYGQTQGVPHKSKPIDAVSSCQGDMPDWFRRGVESALLAPTAVNQQRFHFELVGDKVHATTTWGFYAKMDLGIAKYHFETGAEVGHTIWA